MFINESYASSGDFRVLTHRTLTISTITVLQPMIYYLGYWHSELIGLIAHFVFGVFCIAHEVAFTVIGEFYLSRILGMIPVMVTASIDSAQSLTAQFY
nr:hypothetical transcript [Hymenolepis microstoma]